MPISYKLVGVTNTRTTCTELDHKDWDSTKTEYTREDVGQMKTRVEAFLEMLNARMDF